MKALTRILTTLFLFAALSACGQGIDPGNVQSSQYANAAAGFNAHGVLTGLGSGTSTSVGSLSVSGNLAVYATGTAHSLVKGGIGLTNNPIVNGQGFALSYFSDTTSMHATSSTLYFGNAAPLGGQASIFAVFNSLNDTVNTAFRVSPLNVAYQGSGYNNAIKFSADTTLFQIYDPYTTNSSGQGQQWFTVYTPNGTCTLGDNQKLANGTSILLNDSAKTIVMETAGVFQVADTNTIISNPLLTVNVGTGITNAKNLQFTALDSAQIYTKPSPVTGQTYLCTNCTGFLYCSTCTQRTSNVFVTWNGSLWLRDN